MLAVLRRDLEAARRRDPAARSALEVALCYPGLHAIWGHRVGHWLWTHDLKLAGRVVSTFVRWLTAVDIHPGASLGPGLFIDHATGVVIGETAEVGEDVTLYHGVTLGGTNLEKVKRHPTVGDRVTIGAGAKILGPVTIGHDSRVGANAVVVRDVPANSVVVGVPGQVIARSRPRRPAAPAELEDAGLLPDLVGVTLQSLLSRVDELETAVTGHRGDGSPRPSEAGVWSGEDFSI
ncbi:MAG: serine O-acetyltransferase [Acidimicrobiia bacterium]|nr:serine O-acetyltransferase [Acidimicrobiia bacterium]